MTDDGHPMIRALGAVPAELRGKAVTPDDRRYRLLRSTHTKVASPAMVLLPENTQEVVLAQRYAAEQGGPVSVRSGGHGLAGTSSNDGGVVIDLSAINAIEVLDGRTRLIRIGAGARWGQVAEALTPHGLAISSGDYGGVGVGGLATAGGMGWFVRQYGLTIDHIRAVEVVLPTGAIVRATAEDEPELFRQVRGAGASVGIVVWFEIEAIELSTIGFAQIVVEADAAGETLLRWGRYMESAPRELTTINMLGRNGSGFAMSMMAVVASADERLIRRAIEPLLGVGTRLLDQQAQLAPYAALVPAGHHPHLGRQSAAMTNGLLPQVTSENARAIMTAAADDHGPLIQLRSLGGAVNDVAPDATAYPHRHQQALVLALVFPPLGDEELDRVWSEISPHTEGSYRNFESRPTPETSHLLEASGGVPLR